MILASASARRADLLRGAGIAFRQCAVPHEETIEHFYAEALMTREPLEAVKHAIRRVAEDKYRAALAIFASEESILTADTVIFCGEAILGKPRNRQETEAMLRLLAGRRHYVVTGVCLGQGENIRSFAETSEVTFHSYDHDPAALERYYRTGRARDYAGGYGIQDPDFPLFSELKGSRSNVMGLPLEPTLRALADLSSS